MTGEGDDNKPAKVQREDDNDRREAIKARAIIWYEPSAFLVSSHPHCSAQQDTLSRAQAGNATAMLPSNQGSKAAFAPKDVLALAVSPALAQSQVPLYGPLRPDQRKAGGLYRNFRNYEMGQLTETTKEDALALAEKYGLNDAALRARQDREILKRARERTAEEERLAAEKGVELPKLSGKRAKNDDPASEEYLGPWAPYENELQRREVLRVISGGEDGANIVISGTSEKQAGAQDEEGTSEAPEKSTVTFHGKNAPEDWLRPSKTLPKAPEEGTFQLPKRSTFTFKGHTKGVNRIRWFPKSAHMLLSASMDGTCKIWSTGSSKHCIATYTAHTKAVKDVNFTADGRHFYSASFDTTVKMWDTEYGKVVTSFGNGKFPHCVTVHPDESMQNVVICGCQNKKAIQFDSKTGQIVQEYDEHLAAVNTVTFCENNKKIVTTSDDKKLFIWEVGIGVVVKHIAEPYMHAMPAVTLDPQGKFLACQSMDNQVCFYTKYIWLLSRILVTILLFI